MTPLDEAWQRADDLAARTEPRTHADEMRDIAETIARHGAWSNEGVRALFNLRSLADEIAEWEASAAPVGHYGALPPDVVILREWRLRRAGR